MKKSEFEQKHNLHISASRHSTCMTLLHPLQMPYCLFFKKREKKPRERIEIPSTVIDIMPQRLSIELNRNISLHRALTQSLDLSAVSLHSPKTLQQCYI